MVADAITGNISPEATTQAGNLFADATRGLLPQDNPELLVAAVADRNPHDLGRRSKLFQQCQKIAVLRNNNRASFACCEVNIYIGGLS
jgi:hypothetical protein